MIDASERDILSKIELVEAWYGTTKADSSILDQFLDNSDALGLLASTLSTYVGISHREWLETKASYEKNVGHLIALHGSRTKAEARSVKQYETMLDAEGKYRYLKSRLDGVKITLERMTQRISQLKEEWKLAKFMK